MYDVVCCVYFFVSCGEREVGSSMANGNGIKSSYKTKCPGFTARTFQPRPQCDLNRVAFSPHIGKINLFAVHFGLVLSRAFSVLFLT